MINVKNLYKEFDSSGKPIKILNGINVDVSKGEKVAIIGPSGSGKSTFLRCLNGLEKPTSGDIYFENKNITDPKCNRQAVRKDIGMVFQNFNLFPHLTILENITLAPTSLKIYSHKEARIKALELLKKVGLESKAKDYPARLSGGQKQRIAIVRALIMNPKLMLFDEPTSALDPEMVKEVVSVITEIANQGMSMIVVTHEMSFVKQVATRVLFMDQGKIIDDSSPEKMLYQCSNARVSKFINKLI